MGVHDIEGARPKPEIMLQKPDFMCPTDINRDEMFTTKRTTNPLVPSYMVRDEDNNVVEIGEVHGSKPTQFVSPEKNAHDRHLNIQDIEGAKSTSFGIGNIQKERSSPKNPNDIGDIEGSMAGTLKRNFIGPRCSNPLDPEYQLPGHSEEPEVQQT